MTIRDFTSDRNVRVGPRVAGPLVKLEFIGAVILGIASIITTSHLSVFLDKVWPDGDDIYYSTMGLGGLLGTAAVLTPRGDRISRTRTLLALEAFALFWCGANWGFWGVASVAQGDTGVHATVVASILTFGNLWRIGQIVRDLDALNDAAAATCDQQQNGGD